MLELIVHSPADGIFLIVKISLNAMAFLKSGLQLLDFVVFFFTPTTVNVLFHHLAV